VTGVAVGNVGDDACVTWALVAIVVSGALFLAGLAGLHRGRSDALWSAVLALAGVGLAAGGLLVQDGSDVASWIVALPVGAILSVVHGKALFATGGPFRT
jgi:hypothetical protein